MHIAYVTGVGEITIGDTSRGQVVRVLDALAGQIHSLSWSPDGRSFVAGDRDGNVFLWDVDIWQRKTLAVHQKRDVRQLVWTTDSRRFASCASDGVVRTHDGASAEEILMLRFRHGQIHTSDWSPDDRQLAFGTWGDNIVRFIDARKAYVWR